ncbi:Transcription factor IIIA [Irineochytrium annulatum]|nr:Transcription factor IIIA [Irineochytrium annulatum]
MEFINLADDVWDFHGSDEGQDELQDGRPVSLKRRNAQRQRGRRVRAKLDEDFSFEPSDEGDASGSESEAVCTEPELSDVDTCDDGRSTPGQSTARASGKQLVTCSEDGCGKAFKKPAHLKQHMMSHSDEVGWDPRCYRLCDAHRLSHQRPYKCTIEGCPKDYKRASHLAIHALTHAATEEDRKPFICIHEDCGKAFSNQHHLKRHEKAHGLDAAPYACIIPSCAERFKKKSQLRKHLCIHSGTLPYPCPSDGCTKSFRAPSELKTHMASAHASGPRHSCGHDGCESSRFEKWSDLQRHIKESHALRCALCEKVFTRRDTLRSHMKCHEEPSLRELLPCPHDSCERAAHGFTTMYNLKSHVDSVHLGLRPWVCKEEGCGNAFTHKHSLARHRRTAHVEGPKPRKPRKDKSDSRPELGLADLFTGMDYEDAEKSGRRFACEVEGCNFRYRRQYDLDRHVRSAHDPHLR